MEKSWADLFKLVQDEVHKLDSGSLVQLSGTQVSGPHNGYDYSQLDQYVGQMNPYNIGNQLQFHHDFNPKLKISGQAGYGVLGEDVPYNLYEHLFLKETGGSYVFWQVSTVDPDLTLSQSGKDMAKGFQEMREEGIGKLVSSFTPENKNNIAIHYSYPSIHGSWIVDGQIIAPDSSGPSSKTFQQLRRDRDGWVKVLQDAGVGFDFINYSSVEDRDLKEKGYDTLILPMSVALSDEEVEQITKFVQNGGNLIADALPGIMDGHAKFRNTRALAEVFGIRTRRYKREDTIIPEHETNLELDDANKLMTKNNRPELLYNQHENGSAFLLNFFLDEYPKEKLNKNNGSTLAKIRKVLSRADISPAINLTTWTCYILVDTRLSHRLWRTLN